MVAACDCSGHQSQSYDRDKSWVIILRALCNFCLLWVWCEGNDDRDSDSLWNNRAVFRQTFEVTCPRGTNQGVPMPCPGSGTVTVTIVNRCPSPACQGTIDLSQEACASIANLDGGAINVSFLQYVKHWHQSTLNSATLFHDRCFAPPSALPAKLMPFRWTLCWI